MTPLAAYVLLFVAVGVGFIFVHLVAGKLIRPNKPSAEKGTIYECGEPTIGSAWIQFDLRFYVVALLFVIFDVEVAFFFPWAEVFGKANAVANAPPPRTVVDAKDFGPAVTDYHALARKNFDLAGPDITERELRRPPAINEPDRLRQGRLWLALKNLDEPQLKAYHSLGPKMGFRPDWSRHDDDEKAERKKAVVRMLANFRPEAYAAVQKVVAEPASRDALRKLAKDYDQAVTKFIGVQQEAKKQLLAGLGQRPAEELERIRKNLEDAVPGQEGMLRGDPLIELRTRRSVAWRLLDGAPPNMTNAISQDARDEANKLTDAERGNLVAAIGTAENAALALLTKVSDAPPAGFHLDLTGAALTRYADFNDEEYAAIATLPQATLRALHGDTAGSTRAPARRLAWLAFLEVLVFFGVLLVGFAYLWKRGDLAWVRSTAAERPGPLPAGASRETMELEAAGKVT